MGYSGSVQPNLLGAAQTCPLQVAYGVCMAAQQFFYSAAQCISHSNLRYKFSQLAKLHWAAAQHLSAAQDNTTTAADYLKELIAVQCWYLRQAAALPAQSEPQPLLATLSDRLQQQLRGLRKFTAGLRNQQDRIAMAQLVAEIQISSDQLQPLLKFLQPARQ